MISIKNLMHSIINFPLENHCFSLVGGVIVFETDYVEKLVRFHNSGIHCQIARLLFIKKPYADLTATSNFSIEEIVLLITQIIRLFSQNINLMSFNIWIKQWLENDHCNRAHELKSRIYNTIEATVNLHNLDESAHLIIFYLLQAYIVKKIDSDEDYQYYYQLTAKINVPTNYILTLKSQQNLLECILTKHYPAGIPQLCYTRLAYIDNHDILFPDCCITTLRNFINALLYDAQHKEFDLSLLEKTSLSLHPILIDFYKQFHDIEHIQRQSVHNHWAKATNGLNIHDPSMRCKTPKVNPSCELAPGADNMMKICQILFGTSDIQHIVREFNTWRTVAIKVDTSNFRVDAALDLPDYTNKIVLECEHDELEWFFLQQHFRCHIKRPDKQKLNTSVKTRPASLDWLISLVANHTVSHASLVSVTQSTGMNQILHFLTYCLRTPEDYFLAINSFLEQEQSTQNEQSIDTIIAIFNAMPNDAFHLYNKYVLLDKAEQTSSHIAKRLFVDNSIMYNN